jgi:acyl-coenzyme A synthetase/AMP-(fatty) acid ligase
MCEGRTYRTGDYACLRPDGNYEFLGRKDNQVKYMGYRIELSDIEQSLVSIPGVRDAGVVLAESTTDNLDELVAYIEIDEKVSLSDIVPALRSKLPLYMIPKQLFTIARVPRAISGKIDRQALLAYHREKSHK